MIGGADRYRQQWRHTFRRKRLRHKQQRRWKADSQQDESGDRQQARLGAKCGRIGTILAHATKQAKIAPTAKHATRAAFALRARCTLTRLCGTENTVSIIGR
ncbi:MAG TPA: hypothetical protein VEF55_11795 [Candidatus Binatia bacterium]|nr:hypothetical protein [Candidatus Binatia bacterium]